MKITIAALLLLILGYVPGFPGKESITENVKKKIQINTVASEDNLIVTPSKIDDLSQPMNYSTAAYIADPKTGYVFFEKNSQERLPMASTTKLVTAIIVLEKLDPNQTLEVTKVQNRPLDVLMGLSVGDKLKTSELLHGLLIESAADAARTLASNASGSEEEFVADMNEFTQKFNLKDTQFTNAVGYDDTSHYSSAEDLYKIAKIALLNPMISEIVAKISYTAHSEQGKPYYLDNTNKLLSNPHYHGIKTGTTFAANECLISLYKYDDKEMISVILGSDNRFPETDNLIEWTKKTFTW